MFLIPFCAKGWENVGKRVHAWKGGGGRGDMRQFWSFGRTFIQATFTPDHTPNAFTHHMLIVHVQIKTYRSSWRLPLSSWRSGWPKRKPLPVHCEHFSPFSSIWQMPRCRFPTRASKRRPSWPDPPRLEPLWRETVQTKLSLLQLEFRVVVCSVAKIPDWCANT